jgi:hypothetical protein
MYETNEEAKRVIDKEICELVKKGSLTPSEMECLKNAYKTLESITSIEAMGDYINNGDFSFRRGTQSMHDMYRGMPVAYGGDMSYDEMSMRRGRGANGRFVSMNDGYSNRSYHSVNDRIIANLEHELNGDISDFERKRIMDEIQRLREMKD